MKNPLLFLSRVVTAVFFAICLTPCRLINQTNNPPGPPDATVALYLQAVQTGDRDGLKTITAPGHIADEAITEKINRYNHQILNEVDLEYIATESPYFMDVKISGLIQSSNGEKAPFEDLIHLEYKNNQWYIVLGITQESLSQPSKVPSSTGGK